MPFSIIAGGGLSFLSYTQTRKSELNEQAITLKASVSRPIDQAQRWKWGINGFGTLLPFNSSVSGLQLRFLGLNGRVSRVLTAPGSRLEASLAVGIYYLTTLGASSGIGNVSGPQVFPEVSWAIDQSNCIYGYFKFSPVNSGFRFLQLSNRELALGSSWSHRLDSGHPVSMTLDSSDLSLNLSGVQVSTHTLTLGAGYGF